MWNHSELDADILIRLVCWIINTFVQQVVGYNWYLS